MPESFETFLRFWIAENVHTAARTDPNYPESIIRVLGDELIEEATVQGFYGEVVEAAKPYGSVEGYVRHELEAVSPRK